MGACASAFQTWTCLQIPWHFVKIQILIQLVWGGAQASVGRISSQVLWLSQSPTTLSSKARSSSRQQGCLTPTAWVPVSLSVQSCIILLRFGVATSSMDKAVSTAAIQGLMWWRSLPFWIPWNRLPSSAGAVKVPPAGKQPSVWLVSVEADTLCRAIRLCHCLTAVLFGFF